MLSDVPLLCHVCPPAGSGEHGCGLYLDGDAQAALDGAWGLRQDGQVGGPPPRPTVPPRPWKSVSVTWCFSATFTSFSYSSRSPDALHKQLALHIRYELSGTSRMYRGNQCGQV